jgi:uncharacterized metal-binding protein
MAKIDCIDCDGKACKNVDIELAPSACPRREAQAALEEAERIRTTDAEVKQYAERGKAVETQGYGQWPRVLELIEFAKRMGMHHIGIAFCVGLREESASLAGMLRSHGFELTSVACTVNGGCNPVGQALVLNQAQTHLNVVMGLCMGDDILFNKFAEAPTTTLVVKDRVTCHNPCGPLMNRYWRRRLHAQAK